MTESDSSCKMCGKCCHFEIPITLLDIHRIAKYLDINDDKAFEKYIQDGVSSKSGLFMIRKKEHKECFFLSTDNKCEIHKSKPAACRFYFCSETSNQEVIPWISSCTNPDARAELWEQSIAAKITKTYISRNDVTWNDADYYKAILAIYDNTVTGDRKKIKLAKNSDGTPLAMIYDCSRCEKRGACARETPVTLDDIRRIAAHLGLNWKEFFKEKIAPQISINTGGLKLRRDKYCIFFFNAEKHCSIEEVRPMHCRFTPCPQRANTNELMGSLFLGSGTVEEQFRHQVGLSVTREYVAECGLKYNGGVMNKMLRKIDCLVSTPTELEEFSRMIAPYRYVDDTILIRKHQE